MPSTRTRPEPVQTPADENFVSPRREPPLEPMEGVDLEEEARRIFKDDLVDPVEVEAEVDSVRDDRFMTAIMDEPVGLHAKLADLRANFGFIGKTGTNTGVGGGYKFVEAVEISRRFVQMASERGLTMLPVAASVGEPLPSASGKQMVWTVSMTWRVTDATTGEFFDVPSFGQGADAADKALPKAQTNAMKYAILLLLQAAGDDPENDPRTDQIENTDQLPGINITGSNVEGVRQGGRQSETTRPQLDAIRKEAKRLDLSPEALAAVIGSVLGGKAPEVDTEAPINEQQRAVLDFIAELNFGEAGDVLQRLEGTPDDYEAAMAPDDVGAK